ncbi:MAG TPA: hypothetical protein VH639_07685 [Bryobacteraceae bacterium]|jgi:hypothetical protein
MLSLLLLLALPLAAQDSTTEIDNAWVKAQRMKLAPHGKLPANRHPASVTVFLTDARERFSGGGAAQASTSKAGQVSYREAARYGEENLSDQPLEKIVVELKPDTPRSHLAPLDRVTLDPVKLDPTHHLVQFENGRVRVLRTILEPHLKSPMHEHPHYVVVYLTELHTTMALADGKIVDNPRHPGEVAWRDFMKHQTENIGEKQAVEVQIELK